MVARGHIRRSKPPPIEDRWKGSITITENEGYLIEIVGFDSPTNTIFARVIAQSNQTGITSGLNDREADELSTSSTALIKGGSETASVKVTLKEVLQIVLEKSWENALQLKENKEMRKNKELEGSNNTLVIEESYNNKEDCNHFQANFPTVSELLQLGAIWLLHDGEDGKCDAVITSDNCGKMVNIKKKKKPMSAMRLSISDAESEKYKATISDKQPQHRQWFNSCVLRIHYLPNRFPAAQQVDWSKYVSSLDNEAFCLLGENRIWTKKIINTMPSASMIINHSNDKVPEIVYEDPDLGFAILNKPGSLPCHATVDNGVENVLSMFREVLIERNDNSGVKLSINVSPYATLPQRLDTLTSGLLLVSTKRQFASYMAKILEKKTAWTACFKRKADNQDTKNGKLTGTQCNKKYDKKEFNIYKKYRCLVCVKKNCVDVVSQLQKFKDSKTMVTHYVDPTSHAPRKFVEEDFAEEDWWKCCLRITDVGTTFSVRPVPSDCGCDTDSAEGFLSAHPSRMMLSSGKTASVKKSDENFLARSLWGSRNGPKIVKEIDVVSVIQLEVELLTGRTHQIRGQLAALGVPIVGDPLYGGGGGYKHPTTNHHSTLMALQCCQLSFVRPRLLVHQSEKITLSLDESEEIFHFVLNKAWWTQHLNDSRIIRTR